MVVVAADEYRIIARWCVHVLQDPEKWQMKFARASFNIGTCRKCKKRLDYRNHLPALSFEMAKLWEDGCWRRPSSCAVLAMEDPSQQTW